MHSSDKTFLKYLLSLAMMLPAATASAGTGSAVGPNAQSQNTKINAAPDLSGKLAKLGQVNAKAAGESEGSLTPSWLQIIWAQIIWAQLVVNADGTTTERKEIHKEIQSRPSAKDALKAAKSIK